MGNPEDSGDIHFPIPEDSDMTVLTLTLHFVRKVSMDPGCNKILTSNITWYGF